MRCGVSIREYGDLTPRELMLILDEYNSRRQRETEEALRIAYLNVRWQRSKRMPSLREVLEGAKPRTPQKEQSPEEMFAVVKRMHSQMTEGGG